MASDREQSVDEIRHKVRQEIAVRLFSLLPVPNIAEVCDMTVEQVFALVRQSESEGTVAMNWKNRKPPRTIKLLDEPISRTKVPMAVSTKHLIQRHQEMMCKLKQYMQSTQR